MLNCNHVALRRRYAEDSAWPPQLPQFTSFSASASSFYFYFYFYSPFED